MNKDNITKIEFNIYDGSRSDIPSVYTDKKFKHFAYGDCFGHDNTAFWLDLNQDLSEHDYATSEHKKIYKIIRGVIEDNF
jgi:hypothetical protein